MSRSAVEPILDRLLAGLKDALIAHPSGVVFALVFGSAVKGGFGPDSDVDVAVYFRDPPQGGAATLALRQELNSLFERDVDLVILNRADPIITMQALSTGRLLVNADPRAFIEFKSRKISEYLDFKRSRRAIEEQLLRKPRRA